MSDAITTRLVWRGNDLMAGTIVIGGVYAVAVDTHGAAWLTCLCQPEDSDEDTVHHPTEAAAKQALEQAAKAALEGGDG